MRRGDSMSSRANVGMFCTAWLAGKPQHAIRSYSRHMARLDELEVDEGARCAFLNLVREVGVQHGIQGIEYAEQIAFFRRQLVVRVSRPTI